MAEIHRVGRLLAQGGTRREVDALDRIGGLSGLRVPDPAGMTAPALLARIHAALEVAPADAVLSGWAAAVVHGVNGDFLDGTWDGTIEKPVEFSVPNRDGARERGGLRLRWSNVGPGHCMTYHGRLITTPIRTAVDLVRWNRRPGKALAALDLSLRFGLLTKAELARFLPTMRRRRGIPLVRLVAPLGTDRALSPKESELRWFWLEAGLPTPMVNANVHDLNGAFVGCVDLIDAVSGYVGEFQGHWHQMWERPQQDQLRFARLGRLGLTADEFTKVDVGGQDEPLLSGRLQRGHARAQDRDQRHDAWHCTLPSLGRPIRSLGPDVRTA